MSDAILGGCEPELTGARETVCVNSKSNLNFERKITHDAEAMHYLKDDPSTLASENKLYFAMLELSKRIGLNCEE